MTEVPNKIVHSEAVFSCCSVYADSKNLRATCWQRQNGRGQLSSKQWRGVTKRHALFFVRRDHDFSRFSHRRAGLVSGATFCFVGYRFFRILIAVWGFFAGFNLCAAAMTALFGQNFLGTTTGWILGLVVGLVFAVVASIVVAPDIAHITNDHGQGQNESDLV